MTLKERALKFHKDHQGKIALHCKVPVKTSEDMTLAYTPGVAEPCLEINRDFDKIYDYTAKGNWVAVVTNGTAVLGLGDIGAGAGLPVMEGKAVLFKTFADVDAFPICLDTKDPDKIIEVVKLMEPTWGGINLEDIKAPECFYIESRLKEICNIPVFHDDQHGTAIVVLAGIMNALKVIKKNLGEVNIVVSGAGSAGISVMKLLLRAGAKNIVACDRQGAVTKTNAANSSQAELATITNLGNRAGSLAEIMRGADIVIGVSAAGLINTEMVRSMNNDAIVFAMANPTPEIMPDDAKAGGARIIGTGRSDFPNQVNNVLAFPGIFRGALDVRAAQITEEMKLAAALAIAAIAESDGLSEDYVIPAAFDLRVAPAVAAAVAKCALDAGIARKTDITPEMVRKNTIARLAAKQ